MLVTSGTGSVVQGKITVGCMCFFLRKFETQHCLWQLGSGGNP